MSVCLRSAIALVLALGASTGSAATFRLLAFTGDPAPGQPAGTTVSDFSNVALNDSGEVAINGRVNRPGEAPKQAIFTPSETIAVEGDQPPGAPAGAAFRGFDAADIGDDGVVAFRADMLRPDPRDDFDRFSGVFASDGRVILEGDPAPGMPDGFTLGPIVFPAVTGGGEIAFRADIAGPGVFIGNDDGLFTETRLVAREGFEAPGLPGARITDGPGRPQINGLGEPVFGAGISGAGVTPEKNDLAHFARGGVVARRGDPATGAGAGRLIDGLGFPSFSSTGDVASIGNVTDTNGMVNGFVGESAVLLSGRIVALEGQAMPGLAGLTFNSFFDVAVNDAGQVAFGAAARFEKPAIFRTTPDGTLELVIDSEDALDVRGETRTTFNVAFPTSGNAFNSRGDVAFIASFFDRGVVEQGVFLYEAERVAGAAPIPLPASAWLSLGAFAGLGLVRARRGAGAGTRA